MLCSLLTNSKEKLYICMIPSQDIYNNVLFFNPMALLISCSSNYYVDWNIFRCSNEIIMKLSISYYWCYVCVLNCAIKVCIDFKIPLGNQIICMPFVTLSSGPKRIKVYFDIFHHSISVYFCDPWADIIIFRIVEISHYDWLYMMYCWYLLTQIDLMFPIIYLQTNI